MGGGARGVWGVWRGAPGVRRMRMRVRVRVVEQKKRACCTYGEEGIRYMDMQIYIYMGFSG